MANKLRAQIEGQKEKIEELNRKIQELNGAVEDEKKQSKSQIDEKEAEWQEKNKIKTEQHKGEADRFKESIAILEANIKEKEAQLDIKELKKLAQSFGEQEDINKIDQRKWLMALCVSVGILIIYAIASIFLTANKAWADRITYYAIDIILISAVWFCATQFSETTKLKHDYGNRKTLAQSFHNILNNLEEDESIKNKFIEKTTDVLCAPVGGSGKEPILTKKVLKDVAEIVGTVANK